MTLTIEFSERTSYQWFPHNDEKCENELNRYFIESVATYMRVLIDNQGFGTYESLMNRLGVKTELRYLCCGWLKGDDFAIQIRTKPKMNAYILEIECREDITNS